MLAEGQDTMGTKESRRIAEAQGGTIGAASITGTKSTS
jgi:hypothetical protein